MNITQQTPQQVKKDEAAHRTRDLSLQKEENMHQERKKRIKNLDQRKLSQRQLVPDNRGQNAKVERAINRQFLLDHNGDINLSVTLPLCNNTEQQSIPTNTIHTAFQVYNTVGNNFPRTTLYDNQGIQSTVTLADQDLRDMSMGGSHNNLLVGQSIDRKSDPMRVLQIKQNNSSSLLAKKTKKGGQVPEVSPSIMDVSLPRGPSGSLRNQGSKLSKNFKHSISNSSRQSPMQSPRKTPRQSPGLSSKNNSPKNDSPKIPNLDLIEDVSRATHQTPQSNQNQFLINHNIMNQTSDRVNQITESNKNYFAPHMTVNSISPMSPSPISIHQAFGQNTAIGFHHRGSELQYIMNMTASSVLHGSVSKGQYGGVPSSQTASKKYTHKLSAKPVNSTPIAQPLVLSPEDAQKSMGPEISNNSFERASKSYFLHQQKMLKKEKERLLKQERESLKYARNRFSKKDINNTSEVRLHATQTDILIDQPQQDGQPGVIVRRSKGDTDQGSSGSPSARYPVKNRNIEFTPNITQSHYLQQQPSAQESSTNKNPQLSVSPKQLVSKSKFLNSQSKRMHQNGSNPSEHRSSKRRMTLDKKKLSSRSMLSEVQLQQQLQNTVNQTSKFYQTANRFGLQQNDDQQSAIMMNRQVVPLVSKMRKVNLLDPQAPPNTQVKNQNRNTSPPSKDSQKQPADLELADSSVKTIFEPPNVRLAPRPLNFVYQIQQERELQQLNTADGVYNVEDQNITDPDNQHYSTDEQQPDEENYGNNSKLRMELFNSTLKLHKGDNTLAKALQNAEKDKKSKKNSRKNSRSPRNSNKGQSPRNSNTDQPQFFSSNKFGKLTSKKKTQDIAASDLNQGDSKKALMQSRTKVKLHQNEANEQQASNSLLPHPDRNNEAGSNLSGVVTLKPPSPATPSLTQIPQKTSQKILLEKKQLDTVSTSSEIFTIESKTRQKDGVYLSSSQSSTRFIELDENQYLHPGYILKDPGEVSGEIQQEQLKNHKDPETFLYFTLLKKMQRNPNANVVRELQKIMVSDQKHDFGQLKPLQYRKYIKRDQTKEQFKKDGVIEQESFQFDELQRKRNEFMNYCLKKIHSAIRDEPMAEKDQKKSPLNVQISNTDRRKNQRNFNQDILRTQYGISFQEDPEKTERLLKGISTLDLKKDKPGLFGLQTTEQIKKFEELNGIRITSDELISAPIMNESTPNIEPSMLPKLSQNTWNNVAVEQQSDKSLFQQNEAIELPLAANTNFNFQPIFASRPDLELTKREQFHEPFKSVSQDLHQQNEASKVHMMTTSQGFNGLLGQSSSIAFIGNSPNIFQRRMRSLEPSQKDQLVSLDQTSRSRITFDQHNKTVQAASTKNNNRSRSFMGIKDFFSSHQRFDMLYQGGQGMQSFQRDEVSKHNNPKFIEMIAKMRDPSLNTDYMLKTGIRPKVIEKPKVRKLNQQTLDKHVSKNNDNQGCPLLPIHKMDPIYHQQMLSQIKSRSPRPKEKDWQQLNVMLPILRVNHTTNIIKNDQMIVIDKSQQELCQQRLVQNTLHTQADLTAPSIVKQTHKAHRKKTIQFDEDQLEHRIKVKDIIAVKKNNERELFEKRWQSKKDIEQQQIHHTSQTNAKLATEIDMLAEQMAQEDKDQMLWTANSY